MQRGQRNSSRIFVGVVLAAAFLSFSWYYLKSDVTDQFSERAQKLFSLFFNFSVAFLISYMLIQSRQDRRKMIDVIDSHILKLEKKLDELMALFEDGARYDFLEVMGKIRFINNEWKNVMANLPLYVNRDLSAEISYISTKYKEFKAVHDNNVKQGKLDSQYVQELKRLALLIEERLDKIRLYIYQ